MSILLVIAILNGDILEIKRIYPIQNIKCEEVRDNKIVLESWKDVYGQNTVIFCTEERDE